MSLGEIYSKLYDDDQYDDIELGKRQNETGTKIEDQGTSMAKKKNKIDTQQR